MEKEDEEYVGLPVLNWVTFPEQVQVSDTGNMDVTRRRAIGTSEKRDFLRSMTAPGAISTNITRVIRSTPSTIFDQTEITLRRENIKEDEEGKYSLCFCSISTQAFKFDIERAARIACQVIKEFLDNHLDDRIRLYLVDLTESETLMKFREKAPKGPTYDIRFSIVSANLCSLKTRSEGSIPCWYIVNASNAAFNSGGSGTNRAIHKACKGIGPSLKKLTLKSYKPPAIVGKAYPVDLVPGCPLHDLQGVRTVIHVVGPNMDPKRKNCLGDDYALGSQLLRKAYESVLHTFYERTGLGTIGKIPTELKHIYNTVPLPRWCFLDTDLRWEAYPDYVAAEIERLMQVTPKGTRVLSPQLLMTIDFEKKEVMSLRKYTCGIPKKIIRATWFWQEENGNWIPYATEIADKLEEAVQMDNFRTVPISQDPPRFVTQYVDGTFRQFRQTKKSNPKGRQVRRGYQGRVLDKTSVVVPTENTNQTTPNENKKKTTTGNIKYEIGCKLFLYAFYSENVVDYYREAHKHFKAAAEMDHVDASLMVGLYSLHGFDVVGFDDEEAIRWITKAAQTIDELDIQLAKPAAIEWFNLIEDRNAESKEDLFSAMAKRWKNVDPNTVVIF